MINRVQELMEKKSNVEDSTQTTQAETKEDSGKEEVNIL